MEMRRGFTLIEIIVYFGLSVVALGLILSLFTVARRTQQQTYSQYLVGGSLSEAIRLIRRELQATALSSIEVQENATGFSCVSAYNDEGDFLPNPYGSPKWSKNVFYHLDSNGSLIRWSKALPPENFLPLASDIAPSQVEGSTGRSVMSGLLPPNKAVEDLFEASPYGGLELSFVRREDGVDSLSKVNPKDSDEYDKHTRLVEVTLRTLEDRSEPDFSEVTFRICPRY